MTALQLGVLALAVWRLSHMVAREAGPAWVLQRLRAWAGATETVGAGCYAESFWGSLLCCPLCLSVWFAALLYGLVELAPWAWPGVAVLAISGAASLLELAVSRR